MGLTDVLNGMQHGPRGQRQPTSASSGGMSPLTMALIGLLAFKAIKHLGGSQQQGTTGQGSLPSGNPGATPGGGNLSDLLKGGLRGRCGRKRAERWPR